MKRNEYAFITFLATQNVVKVTSEEEFRKFKEFLNKHGLLGILEKYQKFRDWQELARINNKNTKEFYFEYDNQRGLTWYDNEQEPLDWYGLQPISPTQLMGE